MPRPILAVVLGLIAMPAMATAAFAQERPPLFPTRDVAITYRITGAQAPQGMPGMPPMQNMTMSWLAAAQTMRIDMAGAGFMVADHRAQRGFMVIEAARMVMDIPMEQALQQAGPSATATYRRTGTDTVAGLACTVWSYQDRGNNGTACVTNEGVMLRAQGASQGQSGGLEATQVTFGTQDPARFQRPQGYQTMQIPGGMGGTQAPGTQRPAR